MSLVYSNKKPGRTNLVGTGRLGGSWELRYLLYL